MGLGVTVGLELCVWLALSVIEPLCVWLGEVDCVFVRLCDAVDA